MNVWLMYRDRDFDRQRECPGHAQALGEDLELATLLQAMAGTDRFVFEAARSALITGMDTDLDTIHYRQAILRDCLRHPRAIRALYRIAVEAMEAKREHHLGIWSRYPGAILHAAVAMLRIYGALLKRLRDCAREQADGFDSEGFKALFEMLEEEFSDAYFACIEAQLDELTFRPGVRLGAGLGPGNESTDHVLCRPRPRAGGWRRWLGGRDRRGYSFRIGNRDDVGARTLSDLKDRGLNRAANALAQANDHILGFFERLRTELAFYIGAITLHEQLAALGAPVCLPRPRPVSRPGYQYHDLYDICLALRLGRAVTGNSHAAGGKRLVIITGANQGGKSCFLRAIGVAQLMMQCGLFVAARQFEAGLCSALYTHYRREEDATMQSGKLDEELARMSAIADELRPHALVLCNESFASTDEREGSEIARQIVLALRERRVTVFFVTHLYEFAHKLQEAGFDDALFLRAQRYADGRRSFKLIEGEPLATSYGEDLYRAVFEEPPAGYSAA